MTQRYLAPMSLIASLACFGIACSDDGTGSTTDEDTETSDTDSGDGDGDPTDSGDGDGDPTDSGDGDGDATTEDPVGCQVWEIQYDLVSSEFALSDTPMGAGDQVNVVEEPYDEDDNIGPGSITVRFADVDGEPGGTAWIVAYDMTLNFLVDSFGAAVTTELQNEVAFNECGVTSADLPGDEAAWDPSAMPGQTSMGMIVCNGFFCGLGGFDDGVPVMVDDVDDAPLNPFTFASDRMSFTSEPVVVQQDDTSTSTWTYRGMELSRDLIDGPECLCN